MTVEWTVRVLGLDDAELLHDCRDVFDHPTRPELVRSFLAEPHNCIVVALEGDRVIGFASGIVYLHPDKPLELFVLEVGVVEDRQRLGVGRSVVEALLDEGRRLGCASAWVATEEDNAPARALYATTRGELAEERIVMYEYDLGEPPA